MDVDDAKMLVEASHEKGKRSRSAATRRLSFQTCRVSDRLRIDPVSVNPDIIAKTKRLVHELKTKLPPWLGRRTSL